MYALEGCKETVVGRDMARWYGNESYLNQYIMFADAVNESQRENDAIQKKQDLAASRVARTNCLIKLLDIMPEEFTAADLQKVMKEKGLSADSSRTYITRMIRRELIMQTPDGFKKIMEI